MPNLHIPLSQHPFLIMQKVIKGILDLGAFFCGPPTPKTAFQWSTIPTWKCDHTCCYTRPLPHNLIFTTFYHIHHALCHVIHTHTHCMQPLPLTLTSTEKKTLNSMIDSLFNVALSQARRKIPSWPPLSYSQNGEHAFLALSPSLPTPIAHIPPCTHMIPLNFGRFF